MNDLLQEAHAKAREYEWDKAAHICERALAELESARGLQSAQLADFLGTCRFKHSFQAPNRAEFVRRMQLAKAAYQKAVDIFEQSSHRALSKRAKARTLYAGFWVSESWVERRELAESCLSLTEEALRSLESEGEIDEVVETRRDLIIYSRDNIELGTDWKRVRELFERAVQIGRRTFDESQELEQNPGILECAYTTIYLLAVEGRAIAEPNRFNELGREAQRLAKRFSELAAGVKTLYAKCLEKYVAGEIASEVEGDGYKAVGLYQEALSMAEKAQRSYAHWSSPQSECSRSKLAGRP